MKNVEGVCLGSIVLGSVVPGDYFIFILFYLSDTHYKNRFQLKLKA